MWLGTESFYTRETEAIVVRMKMLKKNQGIIQNHYTITEYWMTDTETV